MKLTQLTLHKYRDVTPGTELVFSPSFNLVLGDNGTGRTMLLDLISLALSSDFSGLIHEEFSLEYTLAFPGMELRIRVRNERPSALPRLLEDPLETSAILPARAPRAAPRFEPFMELRLQLETPASTLVMRADASGVIWEADGQSIYSQSMGWSLLDRTVWIVLFMTAQQLEPEVKDRLKELLRRTFLLAPGRFDEALGSFEKLGKIQYGMAMRGEDVFPLGLMALPTWLPGLLRERVEGGPLTGAIDILPKDVERSFLARFIALTGFATGRFRVELLEKRSYQDGGRLEFGRFGFTFTGSDGTLLPQERLGFGHKRLLAFLYYLDVNEDFAIADELANGLHPRLVEACMRGLGARQVFLSSQNPLPFEHVPLGSAAEVRASLIHCGTTLRDGREWKRWSNPSGETAAKLFGAYQEGRTPLAALLRTHGLW